jgi:hypothetical protein
MLTMEMIKAIAKGFGYAFISIGMLPFLLVQIIIESIG